ncbi:MBL fold metallo-hydrolase [Amycolatopsis sp. SID8362]|uniref:MBL fold metallo-hydrolase n=1 Tax=Amycolatopsis sp. SID8362 TaxID=2690346 RepID=UPI00136A6FE1|nr:MBL fold metallo-hydrolase [Amycolatopsis sp. SID8362]NBH01980.1 MBL fold metallo-hydrolase [Amycolatopsis sp. SID8362]NED38683.1 MBL fold metallo-hydrolase [Amycolatopsis sp. SID8362]
MPELRTAFAGVSNVLVSDGTSAVLVDGFFSRPSPLKLATRVAPDRGRIGEALRRLGVTALDAVLVAHSHVDHALDAPVVAKLTGATLAGSPSTRKIQEGYDLAAEPFEELVPGKPVEFGSFTVTPVDARHSDGDRVPGEITEPVRLPAKAKAFKTGRCYSFHIAHPAGSVLVHASANFVPGALAGHAADVVYLGIGAAGKKTERWREEYWRETVGAVGARTVRPVHWDAFWRPLSKPLKLLPKVFDDLDTTMATFERLAEADGVGLGLPELWKAE